MLTPLNLTQEGPQSFPLIANNTHCVGEVEALVEDGNLTISYRFFAESTELFRPSLRIFIDVQGLTDRDITSRRGQRSYDKPISIKRNLKGADRVYLCVRLAGLFDDADPRNLPYAPELRFGDSGIPYRQWLDAARALTQRTGGNKP